MEFQPGDYVYPADLPQRLLCRVTETESGRTETGPFQILTLEPVDGPWIAWGESPLLVRFDADVRRAEARSAG